MKLLSRFTIHSNSVEKIEQTVDWLKSQIEFLETEKENLSKRYVAKLYQNG